MQQIDCQLYDPNAATIILQKILSRECKIHRSIPCEYIHVISSEFSPRLCCKCMEERNIPSNEYVSIRLLLEAYSNTIFNAYPKFNDNSIIQKLQQLKGSSDKIQQDIQSFFENLQSTVLMAIEKQKSAQKEKLISLSTCYQDVYESVEQISKIEEFQEVVFNYNNNEEQLKQFIDDQQSQADSYTRIINNKLLQYQNIYERFSLTGPKNQLDQIRKLIEKIQFFDEIEYVPQIEYVPEIQFQSTSSREGYNMYVALIHMGVEWEYVYRIEQFWICYSKKGYELNFKYAKTYWQWKNFDEGQRREQLRILKKQLNISDWRPI